jgi:hypothetical protein
MLLIGAAAVLALMATNATTPNNPLSQGRNFMPAGNDMACLLLGSQNR